MSDNNKVNLSVQAQKAIMMTFQKGLVEQRDVSDILAGLEFAVGEEEGEQRLVCLNPPTVKLNKEQAEALKSMGELEDQ